MAKAGRKNSYPAKVLDEYYDGTRRNSGLTHEIIVTEFESQKQNLAERLEYRKSIRQNRASTVSP